MNVNTNIIQDASKGLNHTNMSVIFSLTLQNDGSPSHAKKFVRLPPPKCENPYKLRFVIPAGAKALNNAKFFTNYPINNSSVFKRDCFYDLDYEYDYINDAFCEISIMIAGAFEYYVEYWDDERKKKRAEFGYFLVDPKILIRSKLEVEQDYLKSARVLLDQCDSVNEGIRHSDRLTVLNMDSICLQTVLPKCLGPISQWKHQLRASFLTGYNFIHFVPLQKRGCSNSPYSIYDQLSLSDDLFDAVLPETEKMSILSKEISRLEHDEGILSITDIVWNHTACNSSWLLEHPESGYNLENSPHLRPAYELDEAILQFSKEIENYKLKPKISNEEDLDAVMEVFKLEVLSKLKLW
jgi:glycogen debranching enzyme